MTRTRAPRLLAVLTLALALGFAGCGGDDGADEFREDYNAAVDRLSKINGDIGQAGSGAEGESNTAVAREFDRIAETAEQTRVELSELDPPEDARDEFDKLLSALEKGVEDLRAVAKAARGDNPEEYNPAVQELAESGQEITAAEDDLKNAVDG